ncbi:MAG: acylphosphatase [Hyphomicrobiaceae bacterium]|nr:MAG: acylphosphatase [Hyphomicrobiaceae bacterium]
MSSSSTSDRRTVRVRIEGRVQGVGFRYWTERVATELGLAGWVRNRRDGGVEAVFSGAADDVDEMLERCRDGPPSARVDFVKVLDEADPPAAGSFEVRPTV